MKIKVTDAIKKIEQEINSCERDLNDLMGQSRKWGSLKSDEESLIPKIAADEFNAIYNLLLTSQIQMPPSYYRQNNEFVYINDGQEYHIYTNSECGAKLRNAIISSNNENIKAHLLDYLSNEFLTQEKLKVQNSIVEIEDKMNTEKDKEGEINRKLEEESKKMISLKSTTDYKIYEFFGKNVYKIGELSKLSDIPSIFEKDYIRLGFLEKLFLSTDKKKMQSYALDFEFITGAKPNIQHLETYKTIANSIDLFVIEIDLLKAKKTSILKNITELENDKRDAERNINSIEKTIKLKEKAKNTTIDEQLKKEMVLEYLKGDFINYKKTSVSTLSAIYSKYITPHTEEILTGKTKAAQKVASKISLQVKGYASLIAKMNSSISTLNNVKNKSQAKIDLSYVDAHTKMSNSIRMQMSASRNYYDNSYRHFQHQSIANMSNKEHPSQDWSTIWLYMLAFDNDNCEVPQHLNSQDIESMLDSKISNSIDQLMPVSVTLNFDDINTAVSEPSISYDSYSSSSSSSSSYSSSSSSYSGSSDSYSSSSSSDSYSSSSDSCGSSGD